MWAMKEFYLALLSTLAGPKSNESKEGAAKRGGGPSSGGGWGPVGTRRPLESSLRSWAPANDVKRS